MLKSKGGSGKTPLFDHERLTFGLGCRKSVDTRIEIRDKKLKYKPKLPVGVGRVVDFNMTTRCLL